MADETANSLGFRYHGQLQSVRHVEQAEFVAALGDRDERWAEWKDICCTAQAPRCGRQSHFDQG